jgi:hypothetical protein
MVGLGLEGRGRVISFEIALDPLTDVALTMVKIVLMEANSVSSEGRFLSSETGVVSNNAKVASTHAGELLQVSIQKQRQSILSRAFCQ